MAADGPLAFAGEVDALSNLGEDDQPVVVVGLMGSGKTTVGSRVAAALGRPFRDSDADLLEWFGDSAAEQYATLGQPALHSREAAHLRDALAAAPPPVVAAAASVVDDAACRGALADAFVVWLYAPPEVLAERMDPRDHRPRYDADPLVMLRRQHQQRESRFREVADLVVDVAAQTPSETIETVLAAVTGSAPEVSGSSAAAEEADGRR